ncbi:MAG: acyltransferase, partial [Frankiales bacterium]|nr:acyltransferase [Frankiales bacterium]
RFVEDPVRTGSRWRAGLRPAYGFAAVGSALLLLVTLVGQAQVGGASREAAKIALARVESGQPCYGALAMTSPSCTRPYARPSDLDTAFAADDVFEPAHRCQQPRTDTVAKLCAFGDTTQPRHTMAVVGNSHAVHFIAGLDLYGRRHGWKVLLAAETDCLGEITVPVGSIDARSPCHAWSVSVQRQLLAIPHLDAVVFTSHVTSDLFLAGPNATAIDLDNARRHVLETWTALRGAGIRVMVVQDVPGTRPDADPACIAASSAAYDPCPRPRAAVVQPNLLGTLAQAHPGLVTYEDLTKYFCDARTCHGLIGGVVVYSDSHHISATYSGTLGRFLGEDVAGMLAQS